MFYVLIRINPLYIGVFHSALTSVLNGGSCSEVAPLLVCLRFAVWSCVKTNRTEKGERRHLYQNKCEPKEEKLSIIASIRRKENTDLVYYNMGLNQSKPLKEVLRENKRMINRAVRELDREKTGLEREEKKLMVKIKKAAKENQMSSVKVMAKVRFFSFRFFVVLL
jgi:hypothetical protein